MGYYGLPWIIDTNKNVYMVKCSSGRLNQLTLECLSYCPDYLVKTTLANNNMDVCMTCKYESESGSRFIHGECVTAYSCGDNALKAEDGTTFTLMNPFTNQCQCVSTRNCFVPGGISGYSHTIRPAKGKGYCGSWTSILVNVCNKLYMKAVQISVSGIYKCFLCPLVADTSASDTVMLISMSCITPTQCSSANFVTPDPTNKLCILGNVATGYEAYAIKCL